MQKYIAICFLFAAIVGSYVLLEGSANASQFAASLVAVEAQNQIQRAALKEESGRELPVPALVENEALEGDSERWSVVDDEFTESAPLLLNEEAGDPSYPFFV